MQVNSVQPRHNPAFGNSPLVGLMEVVNKNFITSFLTQDGLGFIVPRMYEGANRGRERDPETGKKTGPLNWALLRKEGLREFLSGPSSFVIPLGVVTLAKKFGLANNVKTDFIKGFDETFREFAKTEDFKAGNPKAFYERLYDKLLTDSLEPDEHSQEFTESRNRKLFNERRDLIAKKSARYAEMQTDIKTAQKNITADFTALRKANMETSYNYSNALLRYKGAEPKSFHMKEIVGAIHDYTQDALKTVAKNIQSGKTVDEAVDLFTKNRTFSRTLTNVGAVAGIAAFWQILPKIYNWGLKENPALACPTAADKPNFHRKGHHKGHGAPPVEKTAQEQSVENKSPAQQPSFTGFLELSGAIIPATGMAALLYGTCLPPRLVQAHDKHDRAEILLRDVSSFTALLFGAKALSRKFSDILANATGIALNVKPRPPKNSEFTRLQKLGHYFSLGKGVNLLSNQEIVTRYSDIEGYVGNPGKKLGKLYKFINSNGGNAKKVIDRYFKGKTNEQIVEILKDKNNILVRKAQNMNSGIAALSTLVLVPGFIIFLARACEKMTKRCLAKEQKAAEPAVFQVMTPTKATAQTANAAQEKAVQEKTPAPAVMFNHSKTMEQFLS